MRIKALKNFNQLRKVMIPGKMTIEQYRSLQGGDAAEVDQASAEYLLSKGYAEGIGEKENKKMKIEKKNEGGES